MDKNNNDEYYGGGGGTSTAAAAAAVVYRNRLLVLLPLMALPNGGLSVTILVSEEILLERCLPASRPPRPPFCSKDRERAWSSSSDINL